MKYILFMLLMLLASSTLAAGKVEDPVWYEKDLNNTTIVHLYFFWSKKCPHCLQARPDVIQIENEFPWLKLHSLELVDHPRHVKQFTEMMSLLNDEALSVPTFIFCGNIISGYQSRETTGEQLRTSLKDCQQFATRKNSDKNARLNIDPDKINVVDIPLLGRINFNDYSLPVLTVVLAGMDAFNPCAFFVLLFLLSMMVHAQSRAKMLVIGSTFVFMSGFIYFIFMAAWLNLFMYLGEIQLITLFAGLIALLIGLINIKDYFWFKKGLTLGITDGSKPKLFDRMRQMLRVESMVSVVIATMVLAIVANSYELLCTAGFPMIYTRILTLEGLEVEKYYLYLLLYNFIYIIPLLIIVLVFTIKLGSKKLSEHEGQVLKLLSGVMMLLLGAILLLAPELLNNLVLAVFILLLSVATTWLLQKLFPQN